MGAESVPVADDHGGGSRGRGRAAGADDAADVAVADAAERGGSVGKEDEREG